MGDLIKLNSANYESLLKEYIKKQDEKSLYYAEQMSKSFIKNNIPPDEIVYLHNQAVLNLYPDLENEIRNAMNFLLETMIFYGISYQEFNLLREDQLKLKSELEVAANVQKTLLKTKKPSIQDLDIGVISVPANKMNGDYHNFVKGKAGTLGIAIADVVGKGVPAALCMSMIKYSMEGFSSDCMVPKVVLESLNRVVEQNIDPSMFITMFYGLYIPKESKLLYASAGHEPGFHYIAKENKFEEISAKGLVLGVSSDTTYKQYELEIEKDDMIILLTDGVTECRVGDRFIERREVVSIIKKYFHLSAQEIATSVYKHFERLQDFQLKDDFTLIILKKEV